MAQDWLRVKVPGIIHVCCGYRYDSKNAEASNYFRCFAHKSPTKQIVDINGDLKDVKFCITIWLICKNNECITSFTYYYDSANKIITKKQVKGIKYILSLKDKFLANIPLRTKTTKIEAKSKKYLWRYTDGHPSKKFVSNIYNLDDKKVGETPPQLVKIYQL